MTALTIFICAYFLRIPRSRGENARNAQHAGLVQMRVAEVLVISCGKDASFFSTNEVLISINLCQISHLE